MKVLWSKEAISTFEQNIQYLESDWNEKVIQNFFDKTNDVLKRISRNPNTFPLFNKSKNIHRCLVVKQVALFYRIEGSEVNLLSFWNNYQNPEKLNF